MVLRDYQSSCTEQKQPGVVEKSGSCKAHVGPDTNVRLDSNYFVPLASRTGTGNNRGCSIRSAICHAGCCRPFREAVGNSGKGGLRVFRKLFPANPEWRPL